MLKVSSQILLNFFIKTCQNYFAKVSILNTNSIRSSFYNINLWAWIKLMVCSSLEHDLKALDQKLEKIEKKIAEYFLCLLHTRCVNFDDRFIPKCKLKDFAVGSFMNFANNFSIKIYFNIIILWAIVRRAVPLWTTVSDI